jgi:hypothetical protein
MKKIVLRVLAGLLAAEDKDALVVAIRALPPVVSMVPPSDIK